MTIIKAEGSYVWDGEGNKLLDFSSQLVNTNIGHQHPKVVAAIQEQAGTALHHRPAVRQRRPLGGGPPHRRADPRRPEPRVLHQRRRRRQRARDPHGPPAHRQAQGARRVPQLPRRHPPGSERDRRPAPRGLGQRHRRRRALLRRPTPTAPTSTPPRRPRRPSARCATWKTPSCSRAPQHRAR